VCACVCVCVCVCALSSHITYINHADFEGACRYGCVVYTLTTKCSLFSRRTKKDCFSSFQTHACERMVDCAYMPVEAQEGIPVYLVAYSIYVYIMAKTPTLPLVICLAMLEN